MTQSSFPILEFDSTLQAIINPRVKPLDCELPSRGVLCFFADVIAELSAAGKLQKIGALISEIGRNPVYSMKQEGQKLFVIHPGVGAPLVAAFLDELIFLGGRMFIACGGCGVLNAEIMAGQPIILTSAVRDEGTSYHYLPPAREVAASPRMVSALENVFKRRKLPYLLAKTWTTDALYRETIARREQRLSEGCEVVEMEAAAFFSVAQFREVEFGQVVYGGDLVIPDGWERRAWNERRGDRHLLFSLAVEACLSLP